MRVGMRIKTAMAMVAAAALVAGEAAAQQRDCRSPRTKIIGGERAKLSDWPGQVVLRARRGGGTLEQYNCGGALVTADWVLTAAHCVVGFAPELRDFPGAEPPGVSFQAVLGVDDLGAVTADNVIDIAEVVVHEQFLADLQAARAADRSAKLDLLTTEVTTEKGNDIALLRLSRPWRGRPATLALSPEQDPPDGQQLRVAGFGAVTYVPGRGGVNKTFEGGRVIAGSATLQDVGIVSIPTAQCDAGYDELFSRFGDMAIGPQQICGGITAGRDRGSCQGDSGGPLVTFDAFACPVQVGVVSWAYGCGGRADPTVFTRVSAYADWIQRRTGPLDAAPSVLAAAGGVEAGGVASDRQIGEFVAQVRGALGAGAGDRLQLLIDGGKTRFRLGEQVVFEATAAVDGRLLIIDVNADGVATMIFPNEFVAASDVRALSAGETVTIPGREYGFDAFEAQPPLGDSTLIALLAPPSFDLGVTDDLRVARTRGFRPIRRPPNAFALLAGLIEEQAAGREDQWGLAVIDYEIVR